MTEPAAHRRPRKALQTRQRPPRFSITWTVLPSFATAVWSRKDGSGRGLGKVVRSFCLPTLLRLFSLCIGASRESRARCVGYGW